MKKRKTRSLFVLEIVMLFLSILIIAPCLMMIFGSFKTALEANHFNIKPPSDDGHMYILAFADRISH